MGSLRSRFILVLASHGEADARLIAELETSGAKTILARSPAEALDCIRRFDFDAAVITGADAALAVALRLRLAGVPFCVHTKGAPAFAAAEPLVRRSDQIPAALAALLRPVSEPSVPT